MNGRLATPHPNYLLRFNCGDGIAREIMLDQPVQFAVNEKVEFHSFDTRIGVPKDNTIWSLSGTVRSVGSRWDLRPVDPDEPEGTRHHIFLHILYLDIEIHSWKQNASIEV